MQPPAEETQLPTRYDVERAAEDSGLPKIHRDIVFALARRMDQGTTYIPPKFSPSLKRLAAATGWSKRHIQRALNELEELQVIVRNRPSVADARRHHARTRYAVYVDRLRELGTHRLMEARDAEAHPLGTLRPAARDMASTGQGTGRPEARDGEAHSQTMPVPPDLEPDPEIDMVITVIRDRTGIVVGASWAAQVRDLILARPGAAAQRPLAYIRRTLLTDTHIERWLPPQTPKKGN